MRNNLITVRAYCIRPLLTAILALAMAFTFSCSSDDSNDNPPPTPAISSSGGSSPSGESSPSGGSSSSGESSPSGGSSSSGESSPSGGSSSSVGGSVPSDGSSSSDFSLPPGLMKCGDTYYPPEIAFCYKNSKLGTFCGTRKAELDKYDPDKYACDVGHPNWIYLKPEFKPKDKAGNPYNAVLIGTQTWMAENLNYDVPGNTTDLCYNGTANCSTGRLYDWAMAKTICPTGWHLPSDAEWITLTNYVGGLLVAGTKLKAATEWNTGSGYIAGTDDYGFSALPGGWGYANIYSDVNNKGYWWSNTEDTVVPASYASRWDMSYNKADMNRNSDNKPYLFSVRCVMDD